MMTKVYKTNLKKFVEFVSHFSGIDDSNIEFQFERIFNHSDNDELESILNWYKEQCDQSAMKIEEIPLNQCRDWTLDESTGSLVHSSGEFFKVNGIRVSNTADREVTSGWDQPILTQEGYDGGILGLLRQRVSDVPYYLVEAKSEPGNFNIVQISTTVQATFSNLKRAHNGNKTPFSEYFLNTDKMNGKIIFDSWMSEDGGRLFNKRNHSMIVEVPSDLEIELPSRRYRWVTLHQLVKLVSTQNAIVAPHIRGILAGI